MSKCLIETNPALEYRNPPSRVVVSIGHLQTIKNFLSNSDAIERTISALQKYVSIFRKIDRVSIVSNYSPHKLQLGSALLSWHHESSRQQPISKMA